MKKFTTLILIITLLCMGYYIYKNQSKSATEVYDNKLNQLQAEVDKSIKDRQDEQLRKIKLQELQNPEIINKKLSEVGKLIVFEGITQCSDIISESNFWGSKSLDIVLIYNFGISIDLNQIIVANFYDNTVILQIPKNMIIIDYLELNTNETKIEGNKTWFNANYSPEDVRLVLSNSEKETKEKIEKDRVIFDKAMINLKNVIKEFILQLGYDNIIFEEI